MNPTIKWNRAPTYYARQGEGCVLYAVAQLNPRDNYESCTVALSDWRKINDDTEREAKKAILLIRSHPDWDTKRQPARVGYNPVEDREYFIFKADNNGTTYVVGTEKAVRILHREIETVMFFQIYKGEAISCYPHYDDVVRKWRIRRDHLTARSGDYVFAPIPDVPRKKAARLT